MGGGMHFANELKGLLLYLRLWKKKVRQQDLFHSLDRARMQHAKNKDKIVE